MTGPSWPSGPQSWTPARLPALDELHVDGGYGSDEAEAALADADAALIQTAIKGRDAAVRIDIEPTDSEQEGYRVSCPRQSVEAARTRKQWKAEFDRSICAGCPLAGQCPATKGKAARRWYFSAADAARHARWRRWEALPEERKTLRPNVEATVREMKGAMEAGKLPVRGSFATQCHGLLRAIGVNWGRIARYVGSPDTDGSLAGLRGAMAERLDEFLADMGHYFTRMAMPSGLVAVTN